MGWGLGKGRRTFSPEKVLLLFPTLPLLHKQHLLIARERPEVFGNDGFKMIGEGADGLPNTFVPGRNLLFFNYAAILAWRLGIRTLVGGMCDTDYSGYPDCRDNTLKSLQVTLSLGLGRDFVIETPLMHLTKAQSWMLAENLGGKALVDLIRFETETCYEGDRTHRHDWGYGCGVCPACRLRAKGWEEFVRSCGK